MACRHNQPSGITALLLTNEAGKDGSAGEPVLVTACNDCALKLWRMPGFEKRGILAVRVGHSDIVRCLARVRALYHCPSLASKDSYFVTCSRTHLARCRGPNPNPNPNPNPIPKGPGNSFFSGSIDHSIIVWEFLN